MKTFTTLFALTLTATINPTAKAQDTGVHGTVVAGMAYPSDFPTGDARMGMLWAYRSTMQRLLC